MKAGLVDPPTAQQWRSAFQTHLAKLLETPAPPQPLPLGSISLVPDPDTVVPDRAPTPPSPVNNLTTPTPFFDITSPSLPGSPPSPPWPKPKCSPHGTETVTKVAHLVYRVKGGQAVQGAYPIHHTEELLRAVPTQSPDHTGPFRRYTPELEVTPISQLTNVSTPTGSLHADQSPAAPAPAAAAHPSTQPVLDFDTISPARGQDTSIISNDPANREPATTPCRTSLLGRSRQPQCFRRRRKHNLVERNEHITNILFT